METLSQKAVTVQRLRLIFSCAGLFFVGGALFCFWKMAGLLWLSLSFFLAAALMLWYLPAYCRSVSYRLKEEVLLIRAGVVIKKTVVIQQDRVQYVRLIQTPLARCFQTASLLFFLAGQTLWLGELDAEQAKRLQEVFASEGEGAENPSDPDFS